MKLDDLKKLCDEVTPESIDALVCGWTMISGVALSEDQLNSLVDLLADKFAADLEALPKLIAVAEALEKARHHVLLRGVFDNPDMCGTPGSLWGLLKPGIDALAALEAE